MAEIPRPRQPDQSEEITWEGCWDEFWEAMADAIAEARIRQARTRSAA